MSKSTPPILDYTGAANAQGAASLWNTQYQTYANRPDIFTPFGSVTWNRPDPVNPYGAGVPDRSGGEPSGRPAPQPRVGTSPIGVAGTRASTGAPTAGTAAAGTGWASDRPWSTDGGGGGGIYGGMRDIGRSSPTLGIGGSIGRGADGGGADGESPMPNFNQDFGDWSMNLTLSPAQQQALEAQQRIQAGRSGVAENVMGRVGEELGSAPDWGSIPGLVSGEDARRQAIDATYGQASSRLDPQWNQREAQLKNELVNQGAMPGSPMYEQQMANFERARNDAYTSAMNNATMYGEQAASGAFGRSLTGRQQGISDLLQRRGSSLNEMQALLGGAQVSMPNMPGFSQAGVSQAPNYLGAAQATYGAGLNNFNAQQAQLQSLLGGGMNLAALGFGF